MLHSQYSPDREECDCNDMGLHDFKNTEEIIFINATTNACGYIKNKTWPSIPPDLNPTEYPFLYLKNKMIKCV